MNAKTKLLPALALLFVAGAAAPGHADRIASVNAKPKAPPHVVKNVRAPFELQRERVKRLVLQRRALQMKRLQLYRNRGVFPRNTYKNRIMRVLVDRDGRFCAVANLIALDGNRLLVLQTAKTNRFVEFAKLKSGPLVDWVMTSGFTMAEIAAIQLPDRRIGWRNPVERERVRIIAHLARVEALLKAQQQTSVDAIVNRIMKQPRLLAQLFMSMRYKNTQPV